MSDFTAKYRPQTNSELDLTFAREQISKIFSSGKVPHALLFSGPRGIGKTSAARIVAKTVNCLEPTKEGEPCNKCDQCVSITNGSNLDILEIDAASNRGIDDIRDLKEKIKLAPTRAKYKVYIIDEVHMLTTEAFNALLKTLEEPPEHAIFILCTTAPEKLPETITSRCLQINFKRASEKEIIEKLEKISKEEKIEIEKEALAKIAKAVNGSFRDATKILEQLSFAKGKITVDFVAEILGQITGLGPEKLLVLLVDKDTVDGIKEIDRIVESGGNLRVYTEQLLELLRLGMLAKLGVTDITEIQQITLSIEDYKRLIEIFAKAGLELKDAVIPQLPLEMAVVEWCVEGQEKRDVGSKKREEEDENQKKKEPESRISPLASHLSTVSSSSSISLESIQNKWPEVLKGVKPKNHSVEALLRATRPLEVKNNFLILEVFYKFHKDKLESEKCRQILEDTINEVYGEPIQIRCVLGERKPANTESLKETETLKDAETQNDDIIKSAEEIFSVSVE